MSVIYRKLIGEDISLFYFSKIDSCLSEHLSVSMTQYFFLGSFLVTQKEKKVRGQEFRPLRLEELATSRVYY